MPRRNALGKLWIAVLVIAMLTTNGWTQRHGGGGGGGMGGGGGGGGGGTGSDTTLTTFTSNDFSGSGNCALCHSGRIDTTGQDVSMDRQWRSTMMANSAKDPLWQAKISSEVHRNPALRAVIEDKCSRCHTPMARVQALTDGLAVTVLDAGFLNQTHPLHEAAMDGVSCSVCHQIDEAGLGTPASFTGGYVIDTTTSSPYRWIYGSFAQPFQNPMRMQVGYTPVQRNHINESSYCGSCHTLYTPIVDAGGNILGEFPEQTPYLEWEHSAFSDPAETQHCQDCHVPDGDGAVALSNRPNWLSGRFPVGQHTFVGGNTLLVNIFKDHGGKLGITAEAVHLNDTAALTAEQLTRATGSLSIYNPSVANGTLTFDVQVSNLAGHKLPTGVPTRRAWLYVYVTDKNGGELFVSGRPRLDGGIINNNADDAPGQFEPHYQRITSPEQVQIYEAIMHDSDGALTYTFLNAAGYLKDNRLLPEGFVKATASPDIDVYGLAAGDGDFTEGGDSVTYEIDVSGATGRQLQISAELLYQAVGRRFVEDLRPDATAEIQRFAGYYDSADKTPVVIATASATARVQ